MSKSRMFSFITKTWNPIGGKCIHNCIYCWSMNNKGLVNKYKLQKYYGVIKLYEKELNKQFKEEDFVFVQDMSDLFADNVPKEYILKVFETIKNNPKTKFLLLTKNPRRYLDFINDFPLNVILGVTIESNLNYPEISKAPQQIFRLHHIIYISTKTDLPIFISIEPILIFDFRFPELLHQIKNLWGIAIGYDNYNNHLLEPILFHTQELIRILEEYRIKVYKKTIRRALHEDTN